MEIYLICGAIAAIITLCWDYRNSDKYSLLDALVSIVVGFVCAPVIFIIFLTHILKGIRIK